MKLFLLPGLGADKRLFRPQVIAFGRRIVALDWLPSKKGETLAGYAYRFAKSLKIPRGSYIGGASLGGMVALEMAGPLKAGGVVLIGSCRNPRSIPWVYRVLAGFIKLLPGRFLRNPGIFGKTFCAFMGIRDGKNRDLFLGMLRDCPPGFLEWALGAVLNWKGRTGFSEGIFHIHGSDDLLIPTGNVRAERIVSGGGHLINLTHSRDVNAFFREILSGGGK